MNKKYLRIYHFIVTILIIFLVACTSPEKAFDSVYYDITGNQVSIGDEIEIEDATFAVISADIVTRYKNYECLINPQSSSERGGGISVISINVQCSKNAKENCFYHLDPEVTHQSGKTFGRSYRQSEYSTSINIPPGMATKLIFASGFKPDSDEPFDKGACFEFDDPPTKITISLQDKNSNNNKIEFVLTE
jgi:hypothetical protein